MTLNTDTTLNVFVDTTKTIHALDIPSKEKAEMLVRTALRMVLEDLADKNIEGAITTLNKYSTIEQYFKRQHADLITQNTVAVGRLRLIRPIGQHVIDNYEHGNILSSGKINITPIRSADNTRFIGAINTPVASPDGKPLKFLKDLPVAHNTYLKWMDAAKVTDEEFESWAIYYLGNDPDNPLKEEDDVHFMLFLRKFFSAKYGGNDSGPSLLPHMKRAYLLWGEIITAYQAMVEEIANGSTPVEQINIVREQMNKAIEVVNSSLIKISELYK